MSFNWPEVPFSGTEVDAFVVAYKEFAQDVLDAYLTEFSENNSIEYIHLPYMTQENMKIYLENALLYSAFVVKQRAGNSGPGTDFELGNSPLNTPLTGPQASTLAGRLGCTFDNDKIDLCYENGDPDNPNDGTSGPGGPNPAPQPPFGDPQKDKSEPQGPCDDYSYNPSDTSKTINGLSAEQYPDILSSWLFWANLLKAAGLGVALVQGRGSTYLAADLVIHYLNSSGSQYTESGLIVADTLGVEIRQYVNKYSASKVKEVSVSSEERSAYGMGAGDKMYSVDFYSYLMLGVSFGTAKIITDGTEVNIGSLIGDINYVKGVIDDYDFEYAYKLGRDEGLEGLPLDPTDTITSGPFLCPNPNDPNSGRSVCESLSVDGHSNMQYVIRLPVVTAHGDGCRDIDDNPYSGRPFPIYIKFNRTSGNGL